MSFFFEIVRIFVNFALNKKLFISNTNILNLAKYIFFCLTLLLSQSAMGDIVLPADTFKVVDSRYGLPENRIRGLAELADGRLVILTAGYLSVYDGDSFESIELSSTPYKILDDFNSYRHLFCDFSGRIWIKNGNELSVFDTKRLRSVDADSLFKSFGTKAKINNFFATPDGKYFVVTDRHDLQIYDGSKSPKTIDNIGDTPYGRLERIEYDKGIAYLCYNNGLIVSIDTFTGKRRYMGACPDIYPQEKIRKGISTLLSDRLLMMSLNKEDSDEGLLLAFDINELKWLTPVKIASQITSLAKLTNGEIAAGGKSLTILSPDLNDIERHENLKTDNYGKVSQNTYEISSVKPDIFGGLWLGTLENGLMYLNKNRAGLAITESEPYKYGRPQKFCSERAKSIAKKVAPRSTNCTLEDNAGRMYIGSVNGLIIVNEKGLKMAHLDPSDNIQALCSDLGGDIWITTPASIKRLRIFSNDSIESVTLNEFDGISLQGKEFRTRELHCDSTGMIFAGFAGGTVRFNPSSVGNTRPKTVNSLINTPDKPDNRQNKSWIYLLSGMLFVALTAVGAIVMYKKSRVKHSGKDMKISVINSDINIEKNADYAMQIKQPERRYPDKDFLDKLKTTVEQHISNPDLSVQTLSQMMSMERSVLYRKMQSLTGMSPSEYIRKIRMTVATGLLERNPGIPVSEVASEVGFTDPKYFSKVFKTNLGVSPSMWADKGTDHNKQSN